MQRRNAIVGVLLALLGCAALIGGWRFTRPVSPGPTAETLRLSQTPHTPTTSTSSRATSAHELATARRVRSYADFLQAMDPALAGAETSPAPLPLDAALSVASPHPIHLDRRGDLWITHPDSPPVEDHLAELPASPESVHLVRDTVHFVHWARDPRGRWVPQVVATPPGGTPTWYAGPDHHLPLNRTDYRWSDAVRDTAGRYVVPTDAGVALLTPSASGINERHTRLDSGRTPVVALAAGRRVFAFRPWENGRTGSERVWVLDDDEDDFALLPDDAGFPPKLIHLFPLTDGAILTLSASDDGGMAVLTLPPPVVEDPGRDRQIRDLIEQLNDPDRSRRDEAHAALARFGPSAWAVLEAELGRQTPEADQILRKLLGLRAKPALGIFELYPGPVRLMARATDGSIALAAYGGIGWYDHALGEQFRSPAVLIVRPHLRARIAHPALLRDTPLDRIALTLLPGDVLVIDPERGPLRFMGNHLAPILPASHARFQQWVGIDRNRRWLFHDPATGQNLLIDTLRLTPTPRLPAWQIRLSSGRTGWDAGDHATLERGGSLWRLEATGWAPLAPDAEFHTEPADGVDVILRGLTARIAPPVPPVPPVPPSPPVPVDGQPPDAGPPIAVLRPAPDRLFILRPGEIHRFRRDGDSATWRHDARFTEDIPQTQIRRAWVDPFGRICIVHGTGNLTVLFPGGVIPRELAPLVSIPSPAERR